MLAILVIFTGILCLSSVGALVAAVKLRHKFEFYETIVSSVFASDGQSPSVAGQAVTQAAEILANRIGITVQASIRGSIGGSSKAAIQGLEEVALEHNPLLASLPKKLQKNPLASMGLQLLIDKIAKNAGNPAGAGNNGKNSQTKFVL